MGIEISQPSTQVDRSYTPKITALTRLWGGYDWGPNQLLKAGISAQTISLLYAADQFNMYYPLFAFISDDQWGSVWNRRPIGLFDSKTGTLQIFENSVNGGIPQRQTDLNGRYNSGSTGGAYISKPTTFAANNSTFYIYDTVLGTAMQIPITADDLNGINKVATFANSSWAVDYNTIISPLANYVFVGFEYGDEAGNYATYEIMFKTTLEIEPWAFG